MCGIYLRHRPGAAPVFPVPRSPLHSPPVMPYQHRRPPAEARTTPKTSRPPCPPQTELEHLHLFIGDNAQQIPENQKKTPFERNKNKIWLRSPYFAACFPRGSPSAKEILTSTGPDCLLS
jgi:hypothetical protein